MMGLESPWKHTDRIFYEGGLTDKGTLWHWTLTLNVGPWTVLPAPFQTTDTPWPVASSSWPLDLLHNV